jgi:hypothetical protein
MCDHVSGMEQLAYQLGILYVVFLARMSEDWLEILPRPTWYKRGRGTVYLPQETLALQAGLWYRVST